MELEAVAKSYRRWAPVYDITFGRVTMAGRRRATAHIGAAGGDVLEVGVGTGMALPLYPEGVRVTGIDYSAEMLDKARAAAAGLPQVAALHRMDARELGFPDASFDFVAAMHVLSVVPEPDRVVAEMARVCRPGGQVVIVNHFSGSGGVIGALERVAAPMATLLGWHSDFPIRRVLGDPRLGIAEHASLPPFGMMTWLVLDRKRDDGAGADGAGAPIRDATAR